MGIRYQLKKNGKIILMKLAKINIARKISLNLFHKCKKYSGKAIAILEHNKRNTKVTLDNYYRESVDELVSKLSKYDVISFDVFDTLIFRMLETPKDVFEILGLQHRIQLFKKIRSEAERDARIASSNVDNEVTLKDIYDLIEKRAGIESELGMQMEIDLEKKICVPNPYMFEVYKRLRQLNKTVIATTDMYLPFKVIEEILLKCGYDDLTKVFLSNKEGRMKTNSGLQGIVKNYFGKEKKYIHVGDNMLSDIEASKKVGWETYYYANVFSVGKANRNGTMSTINGSFYNAVINNSFYSGNWSHNKFYNFGFRYFGILICAYCEWLNKLADNVGATKILFPARDMYIVSEIYDRYFREKDSEYVNISRMSAIFMDFDKSCEMFLNYLKDIAKKGEYTVKEVFVKTGIECCLKYLPKYNCFPDIKFDNSSLNIVRELVYDNKLEIMEHYSEHKKAARDYFRDVFCNHKKVLFADTNGRCTSLLALNHLAKEIDSGIEVIGSFLYSVSDKGYVEVKFTDNSLYAFLFSIIHNKDFFRKFRANVINRTEILEAIFTAPNGSVGKYFFDKCGHVSFEFFNDNSDREYLDSILAGAEDFVKIYIDYKKMGVLKCELFAIDAWSPMDTVLESDEMKHLFNDFKINMELGKN